MDNINKAFLRVLLSILALIAGMVLGVWQTGMWDKVF